MTRGFYVNVLYNVVKNKCCFAVSPSWPSLTHVANPKSDFSTKLIDSLDSELSPESGCFAKTEQID